MKTSPYISVLHARHKKIPFDSTAGLGLPSTLNVDVRAALYSTIQTSTRGNEPVLNWLPVNQG